MSHETKKIAVIGSGAAGLAIAVRLAAKGHQVTVFEKNHFAGGKLSEFRLGEYRFDAGPSLFTMPHWVDELYELSGKDPKEYFRYQKLKVLCNYFWENGKRLEFSSNLETTSKRMENQFGENKNALRDYLNRSRKKYRLAGEIFLKKPLKKISTWLGWDVMKALSWFHGYDLFKTLDKTNSNHFSSPEIIQLFNRYATYNGSDPYRTSGMFSMIPHIEMDLGAWAPEGGMIGITNCILQLGERLGVEYRFNAEVSQIIHDGKKVMGIEVNGETLDFDLVVSNMDISLTYRKLLKDIKLPKSISYEERSSSGFIFYWGIRGEFPELDVHNIFFGSDYKAEFDSIRKNQIPEDPTIYINISSKYNSADAPKGCENWFVMINTPSDTGQDWNVIREKLRTKITAKIEKILGREIAGLIECEEILDPPSLSSRTLSADGALYGSSSNNMWAAFLRHSNQHQQLKGLYLCGGSVHPGGGIPLCLSSARIVDQLIHEKSY